ncbi:DUF6065 family protein [Euzebya rosea]|uniref:DUF6065 family protein n=1 Tax=Euzebya rosea TaxID=2052804 RepID=UPI0013003F76|nr:DUF6065 family protein [Euzebya rosea]
MGTSDAERPLIELYQMMPGAPRPTPAGGSMVRNLPSKALRFCPPVVGATSLGWYVYPPMDFALRFDGQQTSWRDPEGTWHRVTPGEEGIVPSWIEHYRTRYPAEFREQGLEEDTPGLFNADPNAPNRVEMYSGVLVRTAPGWSTLVRGPANLPPRTDHTVFEGIIETGWWVSLLPTIIELTTPGLDVEFRTHRPLAQLQLVPPEQNGSRDAGTVGTIDDVDADLWAMYRKNRLRRTGEDRLGSYVRTSRDLRRDASGAGGAVGAGGDTEDDEEG